MAESPRGPTGSLRENSVDRPGLRTVAPAGIFAGLIEQRGHCANRSLNVTELCHHRRARNVCFIDGMDNTLDPILQRAFKLLDA